DYAYSPSATSRRQDQELAFLKGVSRCRIEELADIHLEDVATPTVNHLAAKSCQRLVRRSPWPEALRAGREVLFVDRFQQHDDRPLENLVLQGRDSDGARLRTGAALRDVHPPHRRGARRARLHPVPQ